MIVAFAYLAPMIRSALMGYAALAGKQSDQVSKAG
jgi:hypothetical protein